MASFIELVGGKKAIEDVHRAVPNPQEALEFVLAMVNRRGLQALARTKSSEWSPFDTGQLVRSIRWRPATARGQTIQGALTVGVIYGRRWEFTHPWKPYYLLRAIREAEKGLKEDMVAAEALFGKRIGVGGGGYRGNRR